ncbi:hypothetical protein niasHT_026543 [Heterodera trifolii]|uniref:Glutathione peroxidase n=1 Tax=Heterodera trifolii TaxID=157864 RepID=A0ABD2KS87_9BILA
MSTATDVQHKSIYEFKANDIDGHEISFDKYRGKVLLVVNVASNCGTTEFNYSQLKQLYDKYKGKGFAVAAFPCNQFGGQEPGNANEIKDFVHKKYNFEPDLFEKIDVNGSHEHPLYGFLKKAQHGTLIDAIKWNFTKFLVDRNGNVVQRYSPNTEPRDIEADIEKLVAAAA